MYEKNEIPNRATVNRWRAVQSVSWGWQVLIMALVVLLILANSTESLAESKKTKCFQRLEDTRKELKKSPLKINCKKPERLLKEMGWQKQNSDKGFFVQTGSHKKYGHSTQRPACFEAILESAGILQLSFPKYNFVIDSSIKNCGQLVEDVYKLSQNRKLVQRNLDSFHSPLHSIYLTNQTKFNHYLMGHMGLYVNVNKSGEMSRRILELKIGKRVIPHEISDDQTIQ